MVGIVQKYDESDFCHNQVYVMTEVAVRICEKLSNFEYVFVQRVSVFILQIHDRILSV